MERKHSKHSMHVLRGELERLIMVLSMVPALATNSFPTQISP